MKADEFLTAYAAAFVSLDAAAVLPFFDFPLVVSGETGRGPSVTVIDQEGFAETLGGLLHAYRALDLGAANVLSSSVFELSAHLHQVSVQWELADESGQPIYEFDATYTVVDGLIRAIAHNEVPELMAALAAKA